MKPECADGEAVAVPDDVRRAIARLAASEATSRAREDRRLARRALRATPTSLRAVSDDDEDVRREARAVVAAFAAALRERGVPPQRMLVLLKDTAREGCLGVADGAGAQTLTDDVVRWCIDAYYAR
jgi:hypothetical protein